MRFSADWGTKEAEYVFLTHGWEFGFECVGGPRVTWCFKVQLFLLPSAIASPAPFPTHSSCVFWGLYRHTALWGRTVCFVPGKKKPPCFFPKLNPLKQLMRTFSMAPSESLTTRGSVTRERVLSVYLVYLQEGWPQLHDYMVCPIHQQWQHLEHAVRSKRKRQIRQHYKRLSNEKGKMVFTDTLCDWLKKSPAYFLANQKKCYKTRVCWRIGTCSSKSRKFSGQENVLCLLCLHSRSKFQ